MPTIEKSDIVDLLRQKPGLSDREITDAILGPGAPPQNANQACRSLESRGILTRQRREDGLIGNHLTGKDPFPKLPQGFKTGQPTKNNLTEDRIKHILEDYLGSQEWDTEIKWGKTHGIDIEAKCNSKRWVIEVKGPGSSKPMCLNYFLHILGEILQKMDDPNAKYSIALPDIAQFRGLWEKFPALAKKRIGITAIFVDSTGKVTERT